MLLLPTRARAQSLNGLELALDSLTHTLRKVLDITLVQPRHANTSIARQVNMRFLGQLVNLLGFETGKAEHANLGLDVTPFARGVELDELVVELGAHGDDSVGHAFDFDKPDWVAIVFVLRLLPLLTIHYTALGCPK
jgi:hypothetical protein